MAWKGPNLWEKNNTRLGHQARRMCRRAFLATMTHWVNQDDHAHVPPCKRNAMEINRSMYIQAGFSNFWMPFHWKISHPALCIVCTCILYVDMLIKYQLDSPGKRKVVWFSFSLSRVKWGHLSYEDSGVACHQETFSASELLWRLESRLAWNCRCKCLLASAKHSNGHQCPGLKECIKSRRKTENSAMLVQQWTV